MTKQPKTTKVYIGYFENYNPSGESVDLFLSVFEIGHQSINWIKYDNIPNAIEALNKGVIKYLIVPSRLTRTNDVNIIMMDLINRMIMDHITEVFAFVDHSHNYEMSKDYNFSSRYVFGNFAYEQKQPCSNDVPEKDMNWLEYRVFSKSRVSHNLFSTIFDFFVTTNVGNLILGLVAIVSSVLVILGLIFLVSNKTVFSDSIDVAIALISAFAAVIELLVFLFKIPSRREAKLVCGYWLYYSFEDDYVSGNYVPKGFTTRLLHIRYVKGNLVFECSFSGNDSLFFSSSTSSYSYDRTSRIGSGTYHYVSNIVNNNNKRAEGVCQFSGERHGAKKIEEMDGWFTGRTTGINGRVKYRRLSKEEYNRLSKAYPDNSQTFDNNTLKVGIFGDVMSNTDVAFNKCFSQESYFKKCRFKKSYYLSFKKLLRDVETRRVDLCIIPISNTLTPIKDEDGHSVYDLFNNSSEIIEFSDKKEVPIKYCLCSNNQISMGSNLIYVSNNNTLQQCKTFIDKEKGERLEYPSTSTAAKAMKAGFLPEKAIVICNEEAALKYELNVLKKNGKNINPLPGTETNNTTFQLFFNKNMILGEKGYNHCLSGFAIKNVKDKEVMVPLLNGEESNDKNITNNDDKKAQ